MINFSDDAADFGIKGLDLFQFAVINPQIAMLSYLKVSQQMVSQPEKIKESQQELLNRLLKLQNSFVKTICGIEEDSEKNSVELKYNEKEQKFEEDVFTNNPMMIFSRKFHETMSQWMLDTLDNIEDVDPFLMSSARFFLKHYIHLMSPDNFPFLNPVVLRETLNTKGENFKKGLEILMNDMKNGTITTNDRSHYEIGRNIAATPGKVIFQNDIIELIQYLPSTSQVFAKPILFVPPWINKFYILDLSPESSFVKWMVDKGFTVFMISWVNPDKKYKNKGFEDYINEGLLSSLDKIYEITKSESIHTIGYCVGGTLISSLLAYLAHPLCKKYPKIKIASATLLATLLDFERAGDMAIFMAENYLEAINVQMKEKGFLDGSIMYNTFSALRAKDMIWRYFVDNYMLGKKPGPHEILFWNSDPTNLTRAMQTFLAKDLYKNNLLKTGTLKIFGVPINLKLIKTPIYMISTKKDHLVPWEATFDGIKLLGKNIKFVLGGSGHVAGIINAPIKNKYSYWINKKHVKTAQEWLDTATEITGSWWNDWLKWIKPMAGDMIDPFRIVNFIRDAPGIYVNNYTPEKLS
ncbi:MAG: alpha/beta fold hydrolase [Holosporaceae bacterium]|jgi:polyhydroxyalkanoate synthase|nr:alpha/beta fold hydrolase [Holosporaceae bacterium]